MWIDRKRTALQLEQGFCKDQRTAVDATVATNTLSCPFHFKKCLSHSSIDGLAESRHATGFLSGVHPASEHVRKYFSVFGVRQSRVSETSHLPPSHLATIASTSSSITEE